MTKVEDREVMQFCTIGPSCLVRDINTSLRATLSVPEHRDNQENGSENELRKRWRDRIGQTEQETSAF